MKRKVDSNVRDKNIELNDYSVLHYFQFLTLVSFHKIGTICLENAIFFSSFEILQ